MATIKINLVSQNIKPTLDYKANARHISVLVDTGAHLPIYFGNSRSFLYDFPSAKTTNYVAQISGLGGNAQGLYPIYEIPDFVLGDSLDSQNTFTIFRMYVVLYDAKQINDYNMLLGATTFSLVDYAFGNREGLPYMRIDFDRDVFGVIRPYRDKDGNPKTVDGKIQAHYMNTFFQDSI